MQREAILMARDKATFLSQVTQNLLLAVGDATPRYAMPCLIEKGKSRKKGKTENKNWRGGWDQAMLPAFLLVMPHMEYGWFV